MIRSTLTAVLALGAAAALPAQTLPVQRTQGTNAAFLTIRNEAGQQIGYGDFVQIAHGSRVSARLTLHFADGSLDDETTVYTQDRAFRLVSDRHIQHGPFFKEAVDLSFDSQGNVTSRTEKDGKPKVDTRHVDLPSDLANGLVGTLLLNLPLTITDHTAHYLAPSGGGRLITLHLGREGEGAVSQVGLKQKAAIFRVHPDLHGLAGVVAPLLGKEPKDIFVWVLPGPAPMLIREVVQLALDTPTLSIETAGTHFEPLANAPTK